MPPQVILPPSSPQRRPHMSFANDVTSFAATIVRLGRGINPVVYNKNSA